MPVVATGTNASARAYGWSATIPESLDGMVLMMPTSVASTGTGNSTTISSNGSISYTSCDSVSLNGVFTADYDNYMIVVRRNAVATQASANFRLRANGTDNSTASSYTNQEFDVAGTSATSSRAAGNIGYFSQYSDTLTNAFTAYLYYPYLTQATAYRGVTFMGTSSARILDVAGTHNQATSYDGITLSGLSASSGLISVYGLEN